MTRVVSLDGPAPAERPRRWGARFVGDQVLLRHYPVLAAGEDLTERTPELWLTRDQWANHHVEYGMDLDGNPFDSQEQETPR